MHNSLKKVEILHNVYTNKGVRYVHVHIVHSAIIMQFVSYENAMQWQCGLRRFRPGSRLRCSARFCMAIIHERGAGYILTTGPPSGGHWRQLLCRTVLGVPNVATGIHVDV